MTHHPFNPKCEVCVRANKKRGYHRRVKLPRKEDLKKFGDATTMDLISNYKGKVSGIDGQCEALICLDINTNWVQIFPLRGKSALEIGL